MGENEGTMRHGGQRRKGRYATALCVYGSKTNAPVRVPFDRPPPRGPLAEYRK